MPRTVSTTCDVCATQLDTTGNSIGYRIVLKDEQLRTREGVVTDMLVYPPLGRAHYFCGTRCLQSWARDFAND